MSDAKEILVVAKEAARGVVAWGEATAAMVAATEAYINALAEVAAQEDAQAFYNESRNIDNYEDRCGLGSSSISGAQSSVFLARREAAAALQVKRVAESFAAEAKGVAEVALKKASMIAKIT